MNNSELTLAAITSGLEDDGTTAAALDAIREESGCTLLGAVLEVARVWHAARAARGLTEANGYLANDSPISKALKESIESNALNVPDGAFCTINVVDGDQWPTAVDNSIDSGIHTVVLASITVGAYWVKREASRIMLVHERERRRPRRRRSQ